VTKKTAPSPSFHMSAEFEPHRATWIAWPHRRDDWPGRFEPIPWVYADIVRVLSRSERVRILVGDRAMERSAAEALARVGADRKRVDFHRFPTDRCWARDFGPIFVRETGRRGRRVIADFHFNAWAKYPDWRRDDRVASRAARALRLPRVVPQVGGRRMVLEGGSIDVNGRGTLLTTEECLLSPVQARNPGVSRADLEAALGKWLGARKVLWLGRGIAGDDTHGHVDDLSRFVGPRTVVTAVEEDRSDINFAPLRENLERLRSMTDQDGKRLTVIELPMPRPVVFDGQRLPASYANFYISNRAVLVPTFNDPADRDALAVLGRLFKDREVVGIHARDLVWGLGTLHCMTHEEPA
jgi:agmatine deiminase